MKTRDPVLFALLIGLVPACAHSRRMGPPPPEPGEGTRAVTAEDIARNPSVSFEELMAIKFPGVAVARTPDGGISVRIRGTSSFMGSNEPLYVLDGIPIQPDRSGTLTGIVASDIESIEVLKDAPATSMYGVRGANGVILIKTKRPRQ